MNRPRTNQIKIGRIITAGGVDAWAVVFCDLCFGPRRLERCWTKPDAIRAAERLSRIMHTPFVRDRRRRPVDQTKFAAWQKRQVLIAQRAAKAAQQREMRAKTEKQLATDEVECAN
jgi:hypothetical protein